MITRAAACVASRTGAVTSPKQTRSMGRMFTTYGSKSLPNLVQNNSKAMTAPSLDSGFFLSSIATFRASMMFMPLRLLIPMPLTAPARPNAAPRRSAYAWLVVSCCSRASTKACCSSALSFFMRGGKQSATERCTASDGVLKTSSKRVKIARTFSSSLSKCTASAPRKTTTPCRT